MNDASHTPASQNPAPQTPAPTWIPSPPPRRRVTHRWRIAIAATAAFVVGCGAAAGLTTVVIDQHQGSTPSASSSTQQYDQILNQLEQSFPGASGSSGSSQYGYPQFDQFGQPGQPGQGSASGATGASQSSTSNATTAQSTGLVEITSTLPGGEAKGTGIILSANGVVVTNHHVVAGATSVEVTDVVTGKTYQASYVGGDATTDVAVLRLKDASGLTPSTLASSAATTGDAITSVGDAGGDGGSLTAAPGTVAALDQAITVSEDSGASAKLSGLMELNAYVVPGDSGGAVLNAAGEVVGMNVAASSGSSVVVGYSIPIATVESVVQQIMSGSTSSQISYGYSGFLGVGLSASTRLGGGSGAVVAEVESGSAAAKVGITAGDTITSFDGTAVTSAAELQQLVGATSSGQQAKVTWLTASGTTHSEAVTLGSGGIA